ncbi:hypothetical protein DERP_011364 [Dermatophagoides pteronyssinus]|uniref:Uncharacterized protein n=1 Tax=Dermatophagoides pteronyssinus TaxID=6956 RepID=A0ABQ8J7H8_DERPT|nr:hypothetical protein DERP_011364 [Dermatophagoides pteronyssinus]
MSRKKWDRKLMDKTSVASRASILSIQMSIHSKKLPVIRDTIDCPENCSNDNDDNYEIYLSTNCCLCLQRSITFDLSIFDKSNKTKQRRLSTINGQRNC